MAGTMNGGLAKMVGGGKLSEMTVVADSDCFLLRMSFSTFEGTGATILTQRGDPSKPFEKLATYHDLDMCYHKGW